MCFSYADPIGAAAPLDFFITMAKINICGKPYEVRQTIRAMFLFEEATGKAFEVNSIRESYLFFYCTILACNKDCSLTWDEFIDACDTDQHLAEEINKTINQIEARDALFSAPDGECKKKSQFKR